jgi:hypothetical protein
MKRLARLATLTVYPLTLLGMLLLGGSKYDWMVDIDPTLEFDAIESDGSRTVVATLLLMTALSAAAILATSYKSRGARIATLGLALLAVIVYAITRQ